MSRAEGFRELRVTVPEALVDRIEADAEALDVGTTTFLTGLVIAAYEKGQATGLALRGIESLPESRRKSRARKLNRHWEKLQLGERPADVAWVSGIYHVERVGDPYKPRSAGPDDGWYLHGGGFDAVPVGFRRVDALKRADELIDIHEKTQAQRVSEPEVEPVPLPEPEPRVPLEERLEAAREERRRMRDVHSMTCPYLVTFNSLDCQCVVRFRDG